MEVIYIQIIGLSEIVIVVIHSNKQGCTVLSLLHFMNYRLLLKIYCNLAYIIVYTLNNSLVLSSAQLFFKRKTSFVSIITNVLINEP